MNQELPESANGDQIGFESMQSVITNVENYCACEERRIRLRNEAEILALRAEFSGLLIEERNCEDRLWHAPRPTERKNRRLRAAYHWCVTIFLTIAGFIFAVLAFEPFDLGWKGYLYALGIAIVVPFLVEKIIERWRAERLLRWIAGLAGAAALLSVVVLAAVRGNLFAEAFKSSTPVVVIEDEPSAPEAQNTFYEQNVPLLRLVMMLLAFAMDLGAGLALHDAWRPASDSGENWVELQKALQVVRGRMTELVYQITALQNEPAVFAARFWRNFYRAALTHNVRSAMTKLLLTVVVLLPLFHADAVAAERITLVMAVDLTQSLANRGPDQKTDFQKNVESVTQTLAQIPAGCRVEIMGITDRSFAQPYVLLRAQIADDPGHFGERLQAARRELVRTWKKRSQNLLPAFPFTDIFGVLFVASQTFEQSPESSRKVLIILSDMRHHTPDVDLESPRLVPEFEKFQKKGKLMLPNLKGVEVYVLGVDGTGKEIAYWLSLEKFWNGYFAAAGATLKSYTALRSIPQITK
ncbi:MAG: hypothetical protein DMG65_19710 [Candidatus Angelobacter sp. Gp1-AA117]|nr:MAG: hypothetical protein DMG65_19710 [Candidatus Angelobacter sp. Gp1-AA117]